MRAAHSLPVEKRDLYLQRIAPCWRCADAAIPDVADVAQLALTGLAQQPAAYPGRAVHPAKIRALRD